jgi:hypothetical protein
MGLMAADATGHSSNARRHRHRVELSDITVAHGALHTSGKVLAMRPGDAGRNLIDSNPWNRLAGFRELGEFLDRGTVGRDIVVTTHAGGDRWKRHQVAWIGIGVTGATL